MILIVLLLLYLPVTLHGEIIEIPNDFETIQAGIDAAEEGDTVLVAPGEYNEFINLSGKPILVTSHFMLDGDENLITETIIDGSDLNRSVVIFANDEDGRTILSGFTIRNGDTDYGGGIYCNGTSPILSHLIVEGNHVSEFGGGIYCTNEAGPLIQNVKIRNNITELGGGGVGSFHGANPIIEDSYISENNTSGIFYGGGVFVDSSSITLRNVLINDNESLSAAGVYARSTSACSLIACTITDNIAIRDGGGIVASGSTLFMDRCMVNGNQATAYGAIYADGNTVITNSTIVGNSALNASGIYFSDSDFELINSIVYGHEDLEIYVYDSEEVIISYSDIEGGVQGVQCIDDNFEWGEGNIDEAPLFVDPDNNDYHLTEDSPCINSGHPDSLDIDWTRKDMGAYPFLTNSVLQGHIFSAVEDDLPLFGATIMTDYNAQITSDVNGFWIIENARPGEFELTASYPYCIDSSVVNLDIGMADTLEVIFRLRHPKIELSTDEITENLSQGQSTDQALTITNAGNAELDWSTRSIVREGVGADPWMLRASYNVGEQLDTERINCVAYADGNYYLYAHRRFEDRSFEVFDNDGNWVRRFPFFSSGFAVYDMAWDGELLWTTCYDTLWGFNTDGEVQITKVINAGARHMCWDSDREVFWVTERTISDDAPIIGYHRDNDRVLRIFDSPFFQVRGLGYWSDDPDGYQLYIRNLVPSDSGYQYLLHKMNIETNDTMFVGRFDYRSNGAFITNEFDNTGSWVFMTVEDQPENEGGVKLTVRQLQPAITWLNFEEREDEHLNPFSEEELIVSIDATEIDTGTQTGEILFTHNAGPDSVVIPITLRIGPNSIDDSEIPIPQSFKITSIYPNPFNSSVTIEYSVPQPERVTIGLYDVSGRLMWSVSEETRYSGSHSTSIPALSLASGIYFVKLKGSLGSQTRKIVLVK